LAAKDPVPIIAKTQKYDRLGAVMSHRFLGFAYCVSLALLSCRQSSKPAAPLVKESAPEPAISIARDAGPVLVDLLYAVPAIVAVSSRVDNARWSPLESVPSFTTLEAACTAFEKRGNDAWDQAKREGIHAWDNLERETSCDPNGPELSAAKGSTAHSVLVASSTPVNYTADFGGDLLAVRTHNASYLTSIKVNGTERTMFETATYRLLDARWFTPKQGTILAVQVAHQFDQTFEGGDPNLEHHSSHTEHRGILCEVIKGKLLCKTIVTVIKGPAENVRAVSVHEQASGEVVFDTR
jgi:hypothetical protein